MAVQDAIIAQFDLEEGDLFGHEEDMPGDDDLVLDAPDAPEAAREQLSRVDAIFDTNDHAIELIRQRPIRRVRSCPSAWLTDSVYDWDAADPGIVEFVNTLATLIDEGTGFSTYDTDSYVLWRRGVQGNYEIDANDTNATANPAIEAQLGGRLSRRG